MQSVVVAGASWRLIRPVNGSVAVSGGLSIMFAIRSPRRVFSFSVALLVGSYVNVACANPVGTVTVIDQTGRHGGPASVMGNLGQIQCNGTGVYSCTGANPVLSGGTGTITIQSSVASGTHYGLINPYIGYQDDGDIEVPNSFTPTCTWVVQVSSNASTPPYWSGKMQTVVINPDSYKSYTPTCQWSSLSVNSSTGDWSVTLTWYN